ncbi:hypothetical protein WN51_12968 [Melipona quadrifasciata]|uniref:Uncharacterized protein n=1 Tax=Melipona quadrifasciata TaxID=166423 RepID=A0A0M9AAC8_9HYME|nr:hypothetical protein WN51_12968 [Melipona quadrifasciata]
MHAPTSLAGSYNTCIWGHKPQVAECGNKAECGNTARMHAPTSLAGSWQHKHLGKRPCNRLERNGKDCNTEAARAWKNVDDSIPDLGAFIYQPPMEGKSLKRDRENSARIKVLKEVKRTTSVTEYFRANLAFNDPIRKNTNLQSNNAANCAVIANLYLVYSGCALRSTTWEYRSTSDPTHVVHGESQNKRNSSTFRETSTSHALRPRPRLNLPRASGGLCMTKDPELRELRPPWKIFAETASLKTPATKEEEWDLQQRLPYRLNTMYRLQMLYE